MVNGRFAMLIGMGFILTFCALNASAQDRHAAPGKQAVDASRSTFHIVATDLGFEAPTSIPAGLRHILFENHGKGIHEGMLVKLPDGMRAEDYVAAVKAGSLFPEGGLDYSGAGLTSPGQTAELWTRLDPGRYIVI
ncbi:MAG TPA: hypothetical protein VFI49_04080 [Rudaea sp.]|nr:hypothetical protein [Rudaea sp.]